MAVSLAAAAAFHWFGVDYAAGAPVDVTGWSDRAIAQLIKKAPVVAAASGGSSSVDAISAESPGTINGGGNVDAWTVDVAAGTSITQAGDTFTLAAGVYFMQALVIGDVTADISFPHLGLAVVGFDAGLQSSGAADAAGGKVYQQMFAVGAAFDLQIAGVATPTYVGLDLFRIGSLTP